ncbi:Xaa-Pro aminopeptidase pepP [Spatholobus suberectus]|nr:Xaa-Pro aminopeptidase pepP [Spatholobus suberectus]
MPPMKIQPIDVDSQKLKEATAARNDAVKPVLKSRLKRLFVFDRQFPNVLRTSSSSEKPAAGEAPQSYSRDGAGAAAAEFEPSSVCLDKMVQSFMEDSNEKQAAAAKCGRNRCNCFNGNSNDSSDEELDVFGDSISSGSFGDASDALKSLIPCASVAERNLLADTSTIVDRNSKVYKRKDDLRKIVTKGLSSLGYDSSICTSKWDKTPSYPAGEYEYIDVVVEGERLIIDIDFRSEFEIARSTGTYKAILQSLPFIFVGKSDRLRQLVAAVSEAAKLSLKKKGMHVPPWRRAEYMLAKWLSSSCTRANPPSSSTVNDSTENLSDGDSVAADSECGELELIFGEKTSSPEPESIPGGEKSLPPVATPMWQPPAVKVRSVERGAKVVTGLASLLKDKP